MTRFSARTLGVVKPFQNFAQFENIPIIYLYVDVQLELMHQLQVLEVNMRIKSIFKNAAKLYTVEKMVAKTRK